MGELGVLPYIIEAVLDHYSGHRSGVAGIYQKAKYEPEMRAALQKWADYLDQITADFVAEVRCRLCWSVIPSL
jgi:hypothetical protein